MTAELKSVRLEAPSASGKKFYQIQINEVRGGYSVDFVYGAVGGTPKTGTKTPSAVTLEKAEGIFDKLQREKETGDSHYRPVDGKVVTLVPRDATSTEQVPEWIAPRLLNDIAEDQILLLTELDNWWVQIKHDGDRVQLHFINGVCTMYSGRSAKLRPCPKAIVDSVSRWKRGSFVMDGELVGETLWAFDLLTLYSTDLRSLPYEERHAKLSESIDRINGGGGVPARHPAIRLVQPAAGYQDKATLILSAKQEHAEGVVFINKNAAYKAGRPNSAGDNLRWKFIATASVIVAAHNMADGKQSIDVRLNDGTIIGTCSVIGKEVPRVNQVVEVAYLYCQEKLVQPRLKGIRHDVPHYRCTRKQLKFKDGIDPTK